MSPLFSPFSLGGLDLPNRIVMAPLTRSRASNDAADAMTALYYTQRASAGLIVSEGTTISREGRGYLFNPGIFSPEQVAGWKTVTDSVHGAGGHMFAQLWHVGRVSHTSLQSDGGQPVSASGKTAAGAKAYAYDGAGKPAFVETSTPRALSTDEVRRVVEDFATAAANAVAAGFDGVEIHGANGYLHEQFLNPHVNDRTDRYTGSTVAGRIAFTLEVVDAIAARIGAVKVGIRISPYGRLFDMAAYDGTEATYLALASELDRRGIAYIHVMDQSGFDTGEMAVDAIPAQPPFWDKLRKAFPTGAIILAGGMTLDRASALIASGTIDLAAFGQAFIANPDLVARLRLGVPLAVPDKATFYGGGAAGYVDYPSYQAARPGPPSRSSKDTILPKLTTSVDYADRDKPIAINSYTTVLRHPKVPYELFATYWRDVHGPLCARIPGLGWYVQNHLSREQDARLWPAMDGIRPFPDYDLDGGVEIGFHSAQDQASFNEACPILFADEQNMFAATVAYALPKGSTTLVDRVAEPSPNGDDGLDRIHLHLGAAHDDAAAFGDRISRLARALAAEEAVLRVRLHLPEAYDNAKPAPPAPNVGHEVPAERRLIAILDLAFASPLARSLFYASDAFAHASEGLAADVAHASPFAVSGVYTYVRDKQLTLAGLRGSRPAQLIERLGARNQVAADVRHLLHTGTLLAR